MDLLSPRAISNLAEVLTHGATKYGDRNWESGIKYSRVYAAVLRHLMAWQDGEDVDHESGLSHLSHAFCGLMFLVHYEANWPRMMGGEKNTLDDRPEVRV